MKTAAFFSVFASLFIAVSGLSAQEAPALRELLLLPVRHTASKSENDYLKVYIYNILKINFERQPSLKVIECDDQARKLLAASDLETAIGELSRRYTVESFIFAEYFVDGNGLHLSIHVWERETLRVKNVFPAVMPAGLDMLTNVEALCLSAAEAVARDLPPREREALFRRSVIARLRRQIDREERLVEHIRGTPNALVFTPMTGLSLGRSVIAWSDNQPLLSPVVTVEYSRFFTDAFHWRVGAEYLPFDMVGGGGLSTEVSLYTLVGYHTQSLFAFNLDAGLAVTYTYNERCAALAYDDGALVVDPAAERISLSLPVEAGFSIFLTRSFFIDLRLRYNGLSFTFEPNGPEAYPKGNATYKYDRGFSPWNFLCFSLAVQAGFRF
ncbi:MAG: hypothetical protein JXD23_12250 [Spirochaetales bacterium]|nr:hypothetical protein [Spirochaetales bacterium]